MREGLGRARDPQGVGEGESGAVRPGGGRGAEGGRAAPGGAVAGSG